MDYREEQEKADREAEKIATDLQTLGLLREALKEISGSNDSTLQNVRGFIVDRCNQFHMEKGKIELQPYSWNAEQTVGTLSHRCSKIERLLTELLED
tara:strand:+ start:7823 stop:8113 length:291 start_codon:yes stop_codon:yes gene_type:complete